MLTTGRKSQLAIEYSYKIRDQSPGTWILWIHASNAARFEQSCQDIADRLKIPGRKDPKANIFQLVCGWLHDERKGKWVLFLDNVDHDQFLHEVPGPESDQNSTRKPLSASLPPSPNGLIIMTTRSKTVALRIVEDSNIIEVPPMDKLHALALFKQKLGVRANEEAIRQLAAALEFMPLAIVQAAAYIKKRGARCSVQQYLEKFQKSDRKKMSLFDPEGGHLRRDWEAKTSIMITWQISFDCIQQIRPSAADLLSLMSFFDRQGIAETLLQNQTKSKTSHGNPKEGDVDYTSDDNDDSATDSSVDDLFEGDIITLRDYMLISFNGNETTFEMHRLVQLATQKWLESHGQLEYWKEVFIRNLSSQFPTGEYENWEKCQRLFPHAQSAVTQQPNTETSLQNWASLMHNAAWYAMRKENVYDAQKMAKEAKKARNKLFGPENEYTLSSIEILGLAYGIGGQWKKAEEQGMQVMKTRKQVLGPKHPGTLTSMGNVASAYRNQGRWKESEELEMQVMKARKQVLGPEHPDTLTSMDNLACAYRGQGQWKKS